MVETLQTAYQAGQVFTVGSVFTGGSGLAFISGLNHITNAINNVAGSFATMYAQTPQLVYFQHITHAGINNTVIGSKLFTTNQIGSCDYIEIQLHSIGEAGKNANHIYQWSGAGFAGVGSVGIGGEGGADFNVVKFVNNKQLTFSGVTINGMYHSAGNLHFVNLATANLCANTLQSGACFLIIGSAPAPAALNWEVDIYIYQHKAYF